MISIKLQCHDKCVNETNFICRSLTYVPDTASGTGVSVCWLHSDDTISVGPRSLKPFLGAMYMERAPCLDCKLTVFQICSLCFSQRQKSLTAWSCYLEIPPELKSYSNLSTHTCIMQFHANVRSQVAYH
jgi:hypothetical protein